MPTDTPIYQLLITLSDVRPAVWRRILVPSDTKLPKLHRIIQTAMGWQNSHLHAFTTGEATYAESGPDFKDEIDHVDESKARLSDILPLSMYRRACTYEYDPSDTWKHEILVERSVVAEEHLSYPLCTGGARACPPEDCGGVGGYETLLEALADDEHEEHEATLLRVGGSFDPEGFDRNAVNRTLHRLR